jgi:hypothetical protein
MLYVFEPDGYELLNVNFIDVIDDDRYNAIYYVNVNFMNV